MEKTESQDGLSRQLWLLYKSWEKECGEDGKIIRSHHRKDFGGLAQGTNRRSEYFDNVEAKKQETWLEIVANNFSA